MPATPFDSRLTGSLFHDVELAPLFAEEVEIAAMLTVWAALARAQGRLGLIPAAAAEALAAALPGLAPDPASLSPETAANGVVVPALLAALRRRLPPGTGDWLHWGATSQDIQDTGLMLRLRAALAVLAARLDAALAGLARLAEAHAALPMAARSYGQAATPTSFGAVAAGWGRPLLAARAGLDALRARVLAVSLGGAAGTLSAMGGQGAALRAELAQALDLADPGGPWHSERDRILALAAWLGAAAAAAGKMGEDLVLLTQTGIEEVTLGQAGQSSTMPQKANPVLPSAMAALARHALAMQGALGQAALHRQARDGAAWFGEWLALPQLVLAAGRALAHAAGLAATLAPNPARMAANLAGGAGLVHAEALTFALAAGMPRPAAQAAATALCAEARATGTALPALAAARFPGTDWAARLAPAAQLGEAPAEARAFAAAVAAR